MKAIIQKLEKMQPAFQKLANNPYLRAIRDGFISLMPVILFSSLFLLVAFVPNIFGIYLNDSIVDSLMRAYGLSMGIIGFLMAATVAKSLTDNLNQKLPKTNQINSISTMVAALIGFMLIAVDIIDGGISVGYMGTTGLLAAFVVGFIVPNIYFFCISRNITVKMPDQVPSNISQTFKDLIPLSIVIIFFWLFDMFFRAVADANFAQWIIELFQPLFNAADGYIGLAIIFGAMAFFWFIGIHGPSIVEPAVAAAMLANVAANQAIHQAGGHPSYVLAQGTQYFVATLGGTGATLVITFMFAFLAKSKQLRAVGRSSAVPVTFGVNEPVLFGAPLVLNPVFFIPFIFTPIINVWLFRFFVVDLGMSGFIYNLPWTTPGPIGLFVGTGFALLALVLVVTILVVDFLIYYPFFKMYDNQLIKEEAAREKIDETQNIVTEIKETTIKEILEEKNVLVLCANGATSGMLANSISKGAKNNNVPVKAIAMAYGQHKNIIQDFDLIILAPQMASMLEELQKAVKDHNTKATTTSGAEYVKLTRNQDEALDYVLKQI